MVFFATPSHKCDAEKLNELIEWGFLMAAACELKGAACSIVDNCANPDFARAALVSRFMRSDCKWLLFRDDDVEFTPPVLRGLIALDAPLAVAPYRRRDKPHPWAVAVEGDRVIRAGLGACLIQRQVIEQMLPRFAPELAYDEDGEPRVALFHHMIYWTGQKRVMFQEDYAFFTRAAECGFGIAALMGAVVNHDGIVSEWKGVLDELG